MTFQGLANMTSHFQHGAKDGFLRFFFCATKLEWITWGLWSLRLWATQIEPMHEKKCVLRNHEKHKRLTLCKRMRQSMTMTYYDFLWLAVTDSFFWTSMSCWEHPGASSRNRPGLWAQWPHGHAGSHLAWGQHRGNGRPWKQFAKRRNESNERPWASKRFHTRHH